MRVLRKLRPKTHARNGQLEGDTGRENNMNATHAVKQAESDTRHENNLIRDTRYKHKMESTKDTMKLVKATHARNG